MIKPTSTAILGSLLLSVSVAVPAAAEDKVPCYNCRTAECPELDAPPCAGPKPDKSRRRKAATVRQTEQPATQTDTGKAATPMGTSQPVDGPAGGQRATSSEGTPATPVAPPAGAAAETTIQAPAPAIKPTPPPDAGQVLPPPVHASRPLRGAAIGLLSGGVVLAAGGAVALGLNHHYGTDCWSPGDVTTCKSVYDTTSLGGAVLGVGAAALVGATVLFVLDARRGERHLSWLLPRPTLALRGE